jgi:hypothetical protein
MAGRIAELVPKATAEKVAAMAIEDRESHEAASYAASARARNGSPQDASRSGVGDACPNHPACRRTC